MSDTDSGKIRHDEEQDLPERYIPDPPFPEDTREQRVYPVPPDPVAADGEGCRQPEFPGCDHYNE